MRMIWTRRSPLVRMSRTNGQALEYNSYISRERRTLQRRFHRCTALVTRAYILRTSLWHMLDVLTPGACGRSTKRDRWRLTWTRDGSRRYAASLTT